MEYTGIIKSYELNRVTIGALILTLPMWMTSREQRHKYPVGTRVRVEVAGSRIVSMIDAPVYHLYEQTTLTQMYIEENTQPEPDFYKDNSFTALLSRKRLDTPEETQLEKEKNAIVANIGKDK